MSKSCLSFDVDILSTGIWQKLNNIDLSACDRSAVFNVIHSHSLSIAGRCSTSSVPSKTNLKKNDQDLCSLVFLLVLWWTKRMAIGKT